MACIRNCLAECQTSCYGCNPDGDNNKFDTKKEEAYPCSFCIGLSTKGRGIITSEENCKLKAFGNVTICASIGDTCCCPKEEIMIILNGTTIIYPFDKCVEVCDGEEIKVDLMAPMCWKGREPKKCGNNCIPSGFAKTLFKKSMNSIGINFNTLKDVLKYNKPMKIIENKNKDINNVIKEAIEYVKKNHPRWEKDLIFWLNYQPEDAVFAIPAFKEVERGLIKLPEGFTMALSHARINDIINVYKRHGDGSVEAMGRGQIKIFRDVIGLENIFPEGHIKNYMSVKEILKILPDNLLDKIPIDNFKNISDDMYLSLPAVLKNKMNKKTISF